MSSKFWGIVTIIFVGFIFVAVLTHAYGFSLAAGTIFGGVNKLGGTLEGRGMASGGTKVR